MKSWTANDSARKFTCSARPHPNLIILDVSSVAHEIRVNAHGPRIDGKTIHVTDNTVTATVESALVSNGCLRLLSS